LVIKPRPVRGKGDTPGTTLGEKKKRVNRRNSNEITRATRLWEKQERRVGSGKGNSGISFFNCWG